MIAANLTSMELITETITLTGASLLEDISELPGVAGNNALYEAIVAAGQL
jgi:hypothetical protein